jgi:tellurium resistance protein TerZ
MGITLSKGQGLSLAKNTGLSRVTVGLGWDPAKPAGGFFSKVFGSGEGGSIDLDASVIVMDAQKRMLDTVWFRQLTGMNGTIRHSGDNRTGEGDGDDESIEIDLDRLPSEAVHLVVTVNSFTGQTFNDVDNAVCRLVDENKREELCRFTLSEKGRHTGVVMASLSRVNGSWEMKAIGEVANGRTVQDIARDAARLV